MEDSANKTWRFKWTTVFDWTTGLLVVDNNYNLHQTKEEHNLNAVKWMVDKVLSEKYRSKAKNRSSFLSIYQVIIKRISSITKNNPKTKTTHPY